MGRIITFYSYKGGTGRSMLLANVAWILASNGKKVLTVDWDLEAPGLHRYFLPFLEDPDLTSSEGVIDFVIDFVVEATTPSPDGERLKSDWYFPFANIVNYAASLDWDHFTDPGTLDFIPSGRQGASYSSRVNSFNWQDFYDRFGGGVFLEAVKVKMREEYDYILIDSRTGVSDTSGICTVQMPDDLVICFTLNNQSVEGAAAVAASVVEQRGDSSLRIYPVPTRVEINEKAKLDRRRRYARQEFSRYLERLPNVDPSTYWADVECLYWPFYAYEEVLATFGDSPEDGNSVLAAAQRVASYLTEGEVSRLVPVPEAARLSVLAAFEKSPKDDPAPPYVGHGRSGAPAPVQPPRVTVPPTEASVNSVNPRILKKSWWLPALLGGLVAILVSGVVSVAVVPREAPVTVIPASVTAVVQSTATPAAAAVASSIPVVASATALPAMPTPIPTVAPTVAATPSLIAAPTTAPSPVPATPPRIDDVRTMRPPEPGGAQGGAGVAFADDGASLLSASCEKGIEIWSLVEANPTGSAVGPAGETCAPWVWTTPARVLQRTLPAFSRDGQTTVWTLSDGNVALWRQGQRLSTLQRPQGCIVTGVGTFENCIAAADFSPDGQLLVTGSYTGAVELWDVESGALVGSLGTHDMWVRSIAFSGSGLIATGARDGTVKIWDATSRQEIAVLRGHTSLVMSVAFSADGRMLASGENVANLSTGEETVNATVIIWDVGTWTRLASLVHGALVHTLAFSTDARMLASGTANGILRVWDTQSGRLVSESQLGSRVLSAAFSPATGDLAVGLGSGEVQLRNPVR